MNSSISFIPSTSVFNSLFSSSRSCRIICLCSLLYFFLWWISVTSLAFGADLQAKLIPLDADFQAKVIHISDGDTITVLTEAKEEKKIRLNGIDLPEAGQAFGNKAKELTKNLVAEKVVTIHAHDLDKYGRTIGDVMLEDGRSLSHELVKAGYGWWFHKYSDDEQLGMLEVKAKIAKVGLWADPNPIPPWIFRHPDKLNIPPARPPPEASLGTITPSRPSSSLPILGNRRSHKITGRIAPAMRLFLPKIECHLIQLRPQNKPGMCWREIAPNT